MFPTRLRPAGRFPAVLSLAVLGLGVLCAAAGAGEPALRYRFQEGQKLNYAMDQKITMTISAGGQEVPVEVHQVMDLTWAVGAVDKDGKARITQTIDRIRVKVDGPTGKMDFDSQAAKTGEEGEGQDLGKFLKGMVGASTQVTMDSRGQTSDFKASDKFKEALKENPAAAMMGPMFTEKGMEQIMNRSGVVFPAGDITKGQSWTSSLDMPVPGAGKMVLTTKTTFEGEEKRDGKALAKLSLAPTVKLETDKDAPVAMQVKEQEAKGTAWFDGAAGRLVETEVSQTMLLQGEGGGQAFSNKIKQRTTFKLAGTK